MRLFELLYIGVCMSMLYIRSVAVRPSSLSILRLLNFFRFYNIMWPWSHLNWQDVFEFYFVSSSCSSAAPTNVLKVIIMKSILSFPNLLWVQNPLQTQVETVVSTLKSEHRWWLLKLLVKWLAKSVAIKLAARIDWIILAEPKYNVALSLPKI